MVAWRKAIGCAAVLVVSTAAPALGEGSEQVSPTVQFGRPHKPERFGNVTVAYVADKEFGLAYPRLTEHPDKKAMERVNAALAQHHLEQLADYRACEDGPLGEKQQGPDAVAEYYFTVEYASPRVISISQHGGNHCGGAHYNQFFRVETYDLGTMAKIGGDLELDATPKGFGQIFKMDSKGDRIAFEKLWWTAWLKMAKKTGETLSECVETEALTGEIEANFYFTRKGLAVLNNDNGYFDTPPCLAIYSTPAIIPWKELKPFLKKGQTLLTNEIK